MLTTEVDNYPGFPEGILGPELMDRIRKPAERFGAEFGAGQVASVSLEQRPFKLTLADGTITSDTIVTATGARAKWLGLPEELEFRTRIGGVSACATCDGFFYKGKHALVVGGGDPAMEEATFLTNSPTRSRSCTGARSCVPASSIEAKSQLDLHMADSSARFQTIQEADAFIAKWSKKLPGLQERVNAMDNRIVG